uniref:Ribosome biogenesis protein SLX9 n=1 Tax=Micromonas pusilla TaxID=38833 RepID=A0A7R9TSN5_MICPS
MVKARMRAKAASASQKSSDAAGKGVDAKDAAAEDAEHDKTLNALPKHQKRKVAKRAEFLEKIRVATASKMKRKGKRRGGVGAALSDFASLEATLGDIAGGASPLARLGRAKGRKVKSAVMRTKQRTRLCASETGRMQAVLAHPEFRSNPIAAISNHIVAALKANGGGAKPDRAAATAGGGEGDAGGGGAKKRREKKKVELKADSDAVARSLAARQISASARGVSFKGENKLGVRYNNAKKNKTGGKKGSKRSAKRAQETW